jgi:hypothetical protein
MKYDKRKNVPFSNKFHYLARAIDIMDIHNNTKFKTDVIGIACQCSSQPKLKREDFDGILDMTIQDVVEKLNIG